MAIPATFVNFANIGATPDGVIRIEFGDASDAQPGKPPAPSTVVVMPRERAREVARIIAEVLDKSAVAMAQAKAVP
jgi:hypothetical protein